MSLFTMFMGYIAKKTLPQSIDQLPATELLRHHCLFSFRRSFFSWCLCRDTSTSLRPETQWEWRRGEFAIAFVTGFCFEPLRSGWGSTKAFTCCSSRCDLEQTPWNTCWLQCSQLIAFNCVLCAGYFQFDYSSCPSRTRVSSFLKGFWRLSDYHRLSTIRV